MNDNAKKWVEALRSGDFKQTTSVLRGPDGYCCLGVATELYRQEHGGEWKEGIGSFGLACFLFEGEPSVLSSVVQDWIGLRDESGGYKSNPSPSFKNTCLAMDNDAGRSFDQIADIIESEPEGLFSE